MLSSIMFMLFSVVVFTFTPKSCIAEMLLQQPSLNLYSPGELEFTDVLVKRVGDNLTLVCELHGDIASTYYWNFVSANNSIMEKPYIVEHNVTGSKLYKYDLSASDSGRYVCSSPPFSQAKYIHVQPLSSSHCAHGAFACGARCVLAAYVCDGRRDCTAGDDEHPALCGRRPCARNDRLNCSSGRCIPAAACCRTPSPLCRQPACCDEQPRPPAHSGYLDMEMPAAHDDRHAPDDYGFIQSTIYTVTACALIFMIAVVLLVSAICKMHMKRAALRSYARADRLTREQHAMQRHRFPPCYSAQLLEHPSPLPSPTRDMHCASPLAGSPSGSARRTRLSALTSVFSSRYRQVPTQCTSVEMTAVTSACPASPSREYRSPARPASPLLTEGAPHLNLPHEHTDRHRLTLQLGRFQLSIPRFGRNETRPDTPNVAEINIDDLDFVRLNSNETYTLNGRTIRLLGGNFENYPPLSHGSHPPPYNEAMRYKLYGPPPEYLSRDRLNRTNSVDEEARSNIEMPPCYDELGAGNANGHNSNVICGNGIAMTEGRIVIDTDVAASNVIGILDVASGGTGLCLIGESSSSNNNVFDNVIDNNEGEAAGNVMSLNNSTNFIENNDNLSPVEENATCIANSSGTVNNNNVTTNLISDLELKHNNNESNNDNNNVTSDGRYVGNGSQLSSESNGNNDTVETLKSVIDNLPAIDSDVNANDNVVESVSC